MQLDLWSILILIALAQGLFVFLLLMVKENLRSRANVFLLLLLLCFFWFQLEFLFIRQTVDVGFDLFYGIRYGSWLLVGPLFYFYVGHISESTEIELRQYLFHFAPAIVFILFIPLLAQDFLSWRQVHYGMLTAFDAFNEEVSFLQYTYAAIFVLQFIHLLFYLVLSHKQINRYSQGLQNEYANIDLDSIRWLRILNITLMVILAFASIFLIIFFFTRIYRRHLDYIYVLPMGFLMYIIGFRLAGVSWAKPQKESNQDIKQAKKYEKSSLTQPLAHQYADRLASYVKSEKPYLNNNLKLSELATDLDIPYHHLSQVFNEQLQTTFFDYINQLRIETCKELIVQRPDANLLEIAFEAGFNNKTSFTNAFKKFENTTPSAYRRQMMSKISLN